MQPKAFLSETTANWEISVALTIVELWIPYFLLSVGQWRSRFLFSEPLSPSAASNLQCSSCQYSGMIEVKRGKKEEIFTWVPKELE